MAHHRQRTALKYLVRGVSLGHVRGPGKRGDALGVRCTAVTMRRMPPCQADVCSSEFLSLAVRPLLGSVDIDDAVGPRCEVFAQGFVVMMVCWVRQSLPRPGWRPGHHPDATGGQRRPAGRVAAPSGLKQSWPSTAAGHSRREGVAPARRSLVTLA